MCLFASEATLAVWLNQHDGVRTVIVALIVLTFIAFALYPERRTVPRVTVYTPEQRGGPWGGEKLNKAVKAKPST